MNRTLNRTSTGPAGGRLAWREVIDATDAPQEQEGRRQGRRQEEGRPQGHTSPSLLHLLLLLLLPPHLHPTMVGRLFDRRRIRVRVPLQPSLTSSRELRVCDTALEIENALVC